MPDPTLAEIEDALALSNRYIALRDAETLHWDRCGEAGTQPIACDHCKDLARLLEILPRVLCALKERHEDTERLDAMIARNWNVEQMPVGPDKGTWFVFGVEGRCDVVPPVGEGGTPRDALDAARAKEGK